MARKVKFDFNPFKIANVQIRNPEKRQEAISEVRDFVLKEVLKKVGDQQSPVSGRGRFTPLKPDYAAIKKKEAGNTKANLELEGDMLDSLSVDVVKGGKLRLTVSDDQQPKADGHNNFTGKSLFPKSRQRQFIPDEKRDQEFKRDINKGISDIVKRIAEDK